LLRQESDGTIRAFIAIDVSVDAKAAMLRLRDRLKPALPGASWTRPEGCHLTLKFLGNISPDTRAGVESALTGAIASAPFEVSFGTLGVFPDRRNARVLWVGLENGADECRDLFNSIEPALESAGLSREERGFKGHITLARFKNRCSVPAEVLAAETAIPPFTADSIILFCSELKPGGAVYTPLADYRLK
jgi:RNA 2',3'-cyclic 3'-phosphodiesterase